MRVLENAGHPMGLWRVRALPFGENMSTTEAYSLVLTGDLSLRQAAEVCSQLGDAINAHDEIVVDGAGFSEIDLSVVQLLVASFKTAKAANKRFSVSFPANGALDKVLQRTGFVMTEGNPLTPEPDPWARFVG
jgi:ABC-type transporter Mla MlaB component